MIGQAVTRYGKDGPYKEWEGGNRMHKDSRDDERQGAAVFSYNRGNHNTFVVFAPIVTAIGGFFILLLLVGGVVFFLTNKPLFLVTMSRVFQVFLFILLALLGVLILFLFIRFVLGAIITYVLGAFVTHVWQPLHRAPVFYANENFMAYERKRGGGIEVHDHSEDRYNYRITQAEAEAPPLLAAPTTLPVPTAAQLLGDGRLMDTLKRGEINLGFLENGEMKNLPYDLLYSTNIGGVGGSGKTTTAFWICVQEVMSGTSLIVVDPHLHVKRRGMSRGLGALLAPYSASYLFTPCDDTPDDIMKRARWMRDECVRRSRPGVNLDEEPQVLMVFDEFNSIIDIAEIRDELGDIIAKVQREGRKLGLFFLIVGHKWAAQDIGNIKIRTNAATTAAHYYNDVTQADVLLGGNGGKACQGLKPGSYLLRGLMTGDLVKISTPMISEADTPVFLQAMGLTVEACPPTMSDPCPEEGSGHGGGHALEQPGTRLDMETTIILSDAQREKMKMVLDMDRQNASQNEIIRRVWGREDAGGRGGQKAADELRLIRSYIAELIGGRV